MMLHTESDQVRSDRSGVTVVEFSIIASLMFVLLFACFEFSRVTMLRQIADTVAYESTRAAIAPGASASDAVKAGNRLFDNARVRGYRIDVSPSVITEATQRITVKTTVPIATNAWGISMFTNGRELTSEMSLLTERNPLAQIRAAATPAPLPPSEPPPKATPDPTPAPAPDPTPAPTPDPAPQPQPDPATQPDPGPNPPPPPPPPPLL